jgi:radical SAM protein with 4Fe4S-binding SPASM domain
MQRLIERGIPFGAIAVLARNTLPHLQGIYCFFDDLRIPLRALAFYKEANKEQARAHALTYHELLQAYQVLFTLWATSANATPVDPIESFIDGASRILSGAPVPRYTVEEENVLLVTPDGSVWGEADCYDAGYCYGNLKESSVEDVLASSARKRAMTDAQERVERICTSCPYRAFCSGEFVATATRSQWRLMEEGCLRREMLSYIVERVEHDPLAQSFINASTVATRSDRLIGLTNDEVSPHDN